MMGRKGQDVMGKNAVQLRGNQAEYVRLLRSEEYPIVVTTGVAGTGKTMLACREAVWSLKEKRVEKIIITRPTVSSDEELGYLPGSLEMKLSPWMKPVLDHLTDAASMADIQKWVSSGMLEMAPLCFMRGRTFRNSFIIGDECQNLRPSLMKMFLTRLGTGSKMVLVGDVEQTDLPEGQENGLVDFTNRLQMAPKHGIGMVHLSSDCVLRHSILPHVLDLYRIHIPKLKPQILLEDSNIETDGVVQQTKGGASSD